MPHSLSAKFLYACLYLISFIAVPATAEQDTAKLPDLGSPDLITYDRNTEQELGRAFTASLHRDFTLFLDEQTNHYIRQLGHKLAGYTGSDRHFAFYVVDDASINAFAGPNGVIGIHTGLINAVHSEDELAAVIAHEISHVTQNHLSRRYEYASSQGNLSSIATLLAAILIGMHDPNAGMATLMGGMGYNLQQQLKNSRLHETEADAIGIQLLHQAGFDPHAMGDFFGRLSKASNLDTFKLPEILRTHPVSESRLAEADNRAEQLDYKPTKEHKVNFDLIKARLANLKQKPSRTEKGQNQSHDIHCYQQMLDQVTNLPTTCLKQTIFNNDASPLYMSEYLNYITRNQKTPSTEHQKQIQTQSRLLLELYPTNSSLLLSYAKYLQHLFKTSDAVNILEQQRPHLKYQYEASKFLSELYAKQNKESHAYLYLAYANIEIGNTERAQYYFEQSQEKANKDDKILNAKIKLFEQENHKLLKNKDKNK